MQTRKKLKKIREVEYFRCWDNHTWDTGFIEIPADTPDDRLEEAVREVAMQLDWDSEIPAIVGLYCSNDDAPEEEDDK